MAEQEIATHPIPRMKCPDCHNEIKDKQFYVGTDCDEVYLGFECNCGMRKETELLSITDFTIQQYPRTKPR